MRVAVLIALAGCYSPAVRDCVLACSSDSDCAAGRSCSAGLCTTNGVSCADPQTTADAAIGSPPSDASGASMIDAPAVTLVAIDVGIFGVGSVTVGATTCMVACTIQVPTNQLVGAVAVGKGDDAFGAWTSTACRGQGASCSFTPTGTTPLDVVFVKQNGNGP
ncbi:MAG TPA: hypothetical protein VGG28_12295 [Kofleriaceae bacterium]|jgi:hypothetical protein